MLTIGPLDTALLAAYLLLVLGIGLWMGRGQRNMSDYLLGGRDLPWWAVLGSIVATETSTVTFLSVPGTAYAEGGNLQFLQLALGYLLGRVLVAWLLLPQYFRGELFTAYEVLHRRFGGSTKVVASSMFLVTRNLSDGLRLYLSAIVLEKMTGLSQAQAVLVMGAVTIVYTMVGGMKSVVWNDCIQLVVYLLGAVLAGIVIVRMLPGGWSAVAEYATEHDKLKWFEPTFDLTKTYTFWAGVIGGLFFTTATHGADQMMVQRYLCARTQRDASRAVIASGLVVFAQFLLFLLLGVGLAAFYHQFPPAQPFQKPDEAFADFIVRHLPVGIRGLTLAAVFSAAMSTLSSSLNSSATAAVSDIYLPSRREPPSQASVLKLSRGLTVFFGVVQIGVALCGNELAKRGVVDSVLAIAAFSTGLVLGVFLLGILTTHVRERAALTGLTVGLISMTLITFLTKLAWPWYTLVGVSITCATGLIVAALFQPPAASQPGSSVTWRGGTDK